MLTRSLKQKESVTRNHRRLKIESGSESDEGPRNKTKYFKNRDKEREAQRKKGFYNFSSTLLTQTVAFDWLHLRVLRLQSINNSQKWFKIVSTNDQNCYNQIHFLLLRTLLLSTIFTKWYNFKCWERYVIF